MQLIHGLRLAAVALVATLVGPAFAASTVFRLTDLDLRDPHLFVSFIGCRDITPSGAFGFSFNDDLQTRIQTDGDSDGNLDLSLLMVFDPLDPAAPGGATRFGNSSCTAPLESTTCGPNPGELLVGLYAANSASGTCLGILPGTVRPYAPAITQPSAPCFATFASDLILDLGTLPLPLKSAQIAATYSGSPASGLANGLIRGFLTETEADITLMPPSYPIFGGMPLSSLLPGGTSNCASHSDKDLGPDGITQGWWMYFNFTAVEVPYTGPRLDVPELRPGRGSVSASPNPFRSSVTLDCLVEHDGPSRVSVHDVSGRTIAELASGRLPVGSHRLTWDGQGAGGVPAPPGLYVIRLSTGGRSITKPVVRLR